MNIFKRLLKIGQAEIHALVEKMEDPISLTEQGIEDLHEQLAETTGHYTRARALVIRTENTVKAKQQEALDYGNKAKLLLQRAQIKEIEQDQAEKLALEALKIKKEMVEDSTHLQKELQSYQETVRNIQEDIDVLKFNISKWEKELATLRAKQKINSAAIFANKQMATLDNHSTIEMLERVKARGEQDNALSAAYGDAAKERLDKDIDYALNNNDSSLKNELEELKRQLKQ